jgi:hypothetical protein
MQRLDDALANEQRELDAVLLRLTTLRVLMASGQHRLVDLALAELDEAMAGFEAAEEASVALLASEGHDTISSAVVLVDDPELKTRLYRRAAQLRTMHRELRVAMASTAAATERSMREAAAVIDLAEPQRRPARRHHGYYTEGS